jgi:hypothetical protein
MVKTLLRFAARKPAFDVFELAVVVGLMLTDVEPLAVIVGRTPRPFLIY